MLILYWGDCFVVFDSLHGPKDIPMGTYRKLNEKKKILKNVSWYTLGLR